MIALIVSSFDTFEERLELLKEYYESKGYQTTIILSDFKHFEKKKELEVKESYIYIPTKEYYKNLSIKRMKSHHYYAKDAFKQVEAMKPDLLHVVIPANSLAKEAWKYKSEHSNVKLYLDINDLWPESMPIGSLKTKFPFTIWKNLRDKHLDNADRIFTECNLYIKELGLDNNPKVNTLYWAKKEQLAKSSPKLDNDKVHLCYLGSINNIIDIERIKMLCAGIAKRKPVSLDIIGDGEKKDEFISELESVGVEVKHHGIIYDEVKKQELFDTCHYAINIMKDQVCVGLTMKSLDYFRGGIPIINTIKFDTHDLVDQWNIGYNLNDETVDMVCSTLVEDNLKQRDNVAKMYEKLFNREAFMKRMEELEG